MTVNFGQDIELYEYYFPHIHKKLLAVRYSLFVAEYLEIKKQVNELSVLIFKAGSLRAANSE